MLLRRDGGRLRLGHRDQGGAVAGGHVPELAAHLGDVLRARVIVLHEGVEHLARRDALQRGGAQLHAAGVGRAVVTGRGGQQLDLGREPQGVGDLPAGDLDELDAEVAADRRRDVDAVRGRLRRFGGGVRLLGGAALGIRGRLRQLERLGIEATDEVVASGSVTSAISVSSWSGTGWAARSGGLGGPSKSPKCCLILAIRCGSAMWARVIPTKST